MKKDLNLVMAVFVLAALCLPALAQEEGAALKENTTAAAPARHVSKKAPARKKAKKKKPAPAESEYKFSSEESVPAYKFDKSANPIIKPAKKKKTAKKGGKKAAAGKEIKAAPPAVKLRPSKPIGAEEAQQPEQQQEQQQQQSQMPAEGE